MMAVLTRVCRSPRILIVEDGGEVRSSSDIVCAVSA